MKLHKHAVFVLLSLFYLLGLSAADLDMVNAGKQYNDVETSFK